MDGCTFDSEGAIGTGLQCACVSVLIVNGT